MGAKLDRLGRHAQAVGATVKLLAKRKIAVIVLQLGKLDRTSPADKMTITMLAPIAEMERDLLAERMQAGLASVESEDKTLGRPSKTFASSAPSVQRVTPNILGVVKPA